MKIIKPINGLILLIPYVCLLGMFTFEATFSDDTFIQYNGWIR